MLPVARRRDIALSWDGTPALVIETESVSLMRYCEVDEAFALAEGENDSLDGWREDHRDYFERNGGFDPRMMLVCERFRLVEDISGEEAGSNRVYLCEAEGVMSSLFTGEFERILEYRAPAVEAVL